MYWDAYQMKQKQFDVKPITVLFYNVIDEFKGHGQLSDIGGPKII